MEELRRDVALGCRILAKEGQGDLIWGHVSARDPEGRGIWMKAAGLGLEEVTPDDVVLVTFDGEVLEGTRPRHSEYPIHTEIMRARGDVDGVVHTHAPRSVALGATGLPLRPFSHEGNLFVPPDVPRFTETSNLILTAEQGRSVAAVLGDRNATFLVNHGVAVAGSDVRIAVVSTVLLERACTMQLRVLAAAGGSPKWTSDEEALAKRATVYPDAGLHTAWDHLVRQL